MLSLGKVCVSFKPAMSNSQHRCVRQTSRMYQIKVRDVKGMYQTKFRDGQGYIRLMSWKARDESDYGQKWS